MGQGRKGVKLTKFQPSPEIPFFLASRQLQVFPSLNFSAPCWFFRTKVNARSFLPEALPFLPLDIFKRYARAAGGTPCSFPKKFF